MFKILWLFTNIFNFGLQGGIHVMIYHVPKLQKMQSGLMYASKLMLSLCYHQCIC